MTDGVLVHPEVRDALADGSPVVVLETAVLTHGLPREPMDAVPAVFGHRLSKGVLWDEDAPANLATSRGVSQLVRSLGGVPASCCVLDGVLRVGIDPDEVERLAGETVEKCSTRDLARVVASGGSGGTTVAGTLAIMDAANARLSRDGTNRLRVFATGGIGGVHRGWSQHGDVSADLRALASTRALVVSAGAKVILDLPATCEFLDTNQIPVVGWRVGHLPRFTVQGVPGTLEIPMVDDLDRLCELCRHHWGTLDREEAILLMNELPGELAMEAMLVEACLGEGLEQAAAAGVNGLEVTPFLLDHLARSTGGGALQANIALLLNNARLATEAAGSLARSAS